MENGHAQKDSFNNSLRYRINTEKVRKNILVQKLKDILFLFVIVFAPPIIPYPHLFLAIYSLLKMKIYYRRLRTRVLRYSGQWQLIEAMIVLAVYALIIIIINEFAFSETVNTSHYVSLFNRFSVLLVAAVPCYTLYILEAKKKGRTCFDFVEHIVGAGLLQTMLVFASFLSNNIHRIFVSWMYRMTGNSWFENSWLVLVRSYGFAGTFVDLFGMGMGLIAGVSLLYGFYHKKKYILYSFLIAIAGTINARTTIVIYVISAFFTFICFSLKEKLGAIVIALFAISIIGLSWDTLIAFMETVNRANFSWIFSGYRALLQLIRGGELGDVFPTLFSESFWQIPQGFQLMFGSGHSLYRANGYGHSDVGYINDLWFVGTVGILWLYGNIASIIVKWWKRENNPFIRNVILFLSCSALVFNIKGSLIGYNPGASTLFGIIFILSYYARSKVRNECN